MENLITWQISACEAPQNTAFYHYEQQTAKDMHEPHKTLANNC